MLTSAAQPPAPLTARAHRARFLFATWDGGGHAAPALSIARTLIAQGHEVRVLADPVLRDEALAAGAEHVPWTTAPHTSPTDRAPRPEQVARTPAEAAANLRDHLTCGAAAAFAADTRAELRRRPADVVVADLLIPGVLIAAEAEGIPTASLSTTVLSLPGWGVPPAGAGLRPARGPAGRFRDRVLHRIVRAKWDKGLPALNAARVANGLAPLAGVYEQVARADRVLVLTSAALEYPGYAPAGNVRLAGARVDDPAWAAAAPWSPPPGDAPLVLVGLSSSYMDQVDLLQRIARGLGALPVRAVLTTGPAIDPAEIPAPPNVHVVRSAPHAQVMRHAAAVVTHAGHGTTAKALSHGLPLVCVPLGRDQHDIAARVVHAGAGVKVSRTAAADRIASAIRAVLDDPRHAAAARDIATTMAAEGREDAAAGEITALAVSRARA